MSGTTVVMIRSPGIMDAERERRLREVFDALFSWAEKQTVAPDTVWGQSQGNGGTPRFAGDGST